MYVTEQEDKKGEQRDEREVDRGRADVEEASNRVRKR